MDTHEIKKLSEKKLNLDNLSEIKKNYEVSFGQYESFELKKCISEKKPFYIKNNFIIGYEDNKFINDNNEKIPIDRMVKAVIIEDIKEDIIPEKTGDYFAIVGKVQWESDIDEFQAIFGNLRVGEIYLPPHSAIFNFRQPTGKEQSESAVSCLEGVQISILSKDGYVDNAIHEIGHIFWREVLTFEEKMKFKEHFKRLPISAVYEYQWERIDEEEVFCTIYKWFVKSILLNPSFYNILEHEDPEGLKLMEGVIERIARDRIINAVWGINKNKVFDYLNPKFDITLGGKFRKKGDFDDIKDIELPTEILNDVNKFEDGITYINLNKAVIPVEGNKIIWDKVNK